MRMLEAPPLGEVVDGSGRRLWFHRSGDGSPAVVFLPGAGCVGLDYLNIHDRVAGFTTSVIYDRAGTGWSESAELPRLASDVVDELRLLLSAEHVAPPYVLVGHSLGGAYARRYAQLHPGEVAALVMLDPYSEGYLTHSPPRNVGVMLSQLFAMARLLPRLRRFYRRLFEAMLADWPSDVRRSLIDYHLRAIWTGLKEGKNVDDALRTELMEGGHMPRVPMIILSSLGIDRFQKALMPESYLRELNGRKAEIYRSLSELPGAEYRTLADAGHSTIHTDRPDEVVRAIRDAIDAIRGS